MTALCEIQLGPVTLLYFEHQLNVEVEGVPLGRPRRLTQEQWQAVVDVVSDRTNLVPVTMVITGLLEAGADAEHMMSLARQSQGSIHFRANDRQAHVRAREIVATALGIS